MSRLRELTNKANGLWAPQERPFTSSAPVVGPVIIFVRRAWNWVSTKWYVRPILEQQIAFNSAIVQVINETTSILERQEQDLSQVREVLAQVSARLEQVTARLEAEETRVSGLDSSLSNQLRESEELTILSDRAQVSLAREVARLSHRLSQRPGAATAELSDLGEALRRLDKVLGTETDDREP